MNSKASKNEIPCIDGIRSLPGFPVVLAGIKDNIITLAAFSFCSFRPPMVMIGIIPSCYSHELVKEVNDFSVNIPTPELLEEVEYCGAISGRDVDKFKKTGLTPIKGKRISSYLIEECPVNLECSVVGTLDVGGSHTWFMGEVVTAYRRGDYDRSHAMMYWQREYRKVGDVIKARRR